MGDDSDNGGNEKIQIEPKDLEWYRGLKQGAADIFKNHWPNSRHAKVILKIEDLEKNSPEVLLAIETNYSKPKEETDRKPDWFDDFYSGDVKEKTSPTVVDNAADQIKITKAPDDWKTSATLDMKYWMMTHWSGTYKKYWPRDGIIENVTQESSDDLLNRVESLNKIEIDNSEEIEGPTVDLSSILPSDVGFVEEKPKIEEVPVVKEEIKLHHQPTVEIGDLVAAKKGMPKWIYGAAGGGLALLLLGAGGYLMMNKDGGADQKPKVTYVVTDSSKIGNSPVPDTSSRTYVPANFEKEETKPKSAYQLKVAGNWKEGAKQSTVWGTLAEKFSEKYGRRPNGEELLQLCQAAFEATNSSGGGPKIKGTKVQLDWESAHKLPQNYIFQIDSLAMEKIAGGKGAYVSFK